MKKLLMLILIIGALIYFGIITPKQIKQVAANTGKLVARQVKKIDRTKKSNIANEVKNTATDIAKETKQEYDK